MPQRGLNGRAVPPNAMKRAVAKMSRYFEAKTPFCLPFAIDDMPGLEYVGALYSV